jgi:uncharacterized BrkB/YihY/UPF0761 family membrane protein
MPPNPQTAKRDLRSPVVASPADRGRSLAARAQRAPGAETAIIALERLGSTGGGLLAGGLAYRFFFWLVSLGAVGGALSSIWATSDPADLEDTARSFGLTATAAASFREAVDFGDTPRWTFLVGGSILTLWFGLGAVKALCVAFALAWRVPLPKIRRRVRASLAFTGLAIGISVGAAVLSAFEGDAPGGRLLSFAALLAFYAAATGFVLSLLPHAPGATLRAHLPGAALLAIGLWGINVWVAVYLAPRLGKEGGVYGAFGTSTAILLWLYVCAMLFTAAAFLNATLWERRRPP